MGKNTNKNEMIKDVGICNASIYYMLRMQKIGKMLNREEQAQLVDDLTLFFLGNNKENKVYSNEEAYQLIRKAKAASIMLSSNFEKVSIDNVVKVITEVDDRTIKSLSDIYTSFLPRDYVLVDESGKEIHSRSGIKQFINGVSTKVLNPRNAEIIECTEEKLGKLRDIAYIYKYISENLPRPQLDKKTNDVIRPADSIMAKIAKSKFIDNLDTQRVGMLIEELTDELLLGEDAFTPEELQKLLKQTTTVLTQSDMYKIEGARNIVDKFREHLTKNERDAVFVDLVDENVKFKNLALKSGSFLKNTKEANEEIFNILTGVSLGDLQGGSAIYTGEDEKERYKNVHIDMSSSQLYHILTQVTSTLGAIRANRLLAMVREFDDVVERVFKDQEETKRFRRQDFKVSDYLTGNNILTLMSLTKDERPKNLLTREAQINKYVDNIRILNAIMSTSAIFKIMRNNMTILNLDSDYLQSQINSLMQTYGADREVLKEKVNEFVNVRFALEPKKEGDKKDKDAKDVSSGSSGVTITMEDVQDDYSQFEVDIDGGVYKEPTYTQKISNMDINECMKELMTKVDAIKISASDLSKVNGEDGKDPMKVRLWIFQCKRIIDRINNLINELDKANHYEALVYKSMLDSAINKEFKAIVKECRKSQSDINEIYSDFYRGKKYHRAAEEEPDNSLHDWIVARHSTVESKAYSAEKKASLLACADKMIESIRGDENKIVNKPRIDGYKQSMAALDQYAMCAVVANNIEECIMLN